MKTSKLYIILLLLLFTALTGCDKFITESDPDRNTIVGSGNLVELEKEFSDFDQISQHNTFETDIIKSDNYSVTIKIDDNLVSYLKAYQDGDKISLGLENGNNYKDVTLKAEIRMPDIASLELSGASNATINGFDFDHDLRLNLSGASFVEGSIRTGDAFFILSGASFIELNGSGNDFYINCSGASNLNLSDFTCIDANLFLSGASISTINISGILEADLSGNSILYYYGDPTIRRLNTSGTSRVIKLD